jgi:hypothetical protein
MSDKRKNIYLKSVGKIGSSITATAKRGGAQGMGNWTRITFETQWGRKVEHTAYINDEKEIDDILTRYQGRPVSITVINNEDD